MRRIFIKALVYGAILFKVSHVYAGPMANDLRGELEAREIVDELLAEPQAFQVRMNQLYEETAALEGQLKAIEREKIEKLEEAINLAVMKYNNAEIGPQKFANSLGAFIGGGVGAGLGLFASKRIMGEGTLLKDIAKTTNAPWYRILKPSNIDWAVLGKVSASAGVSIGLLLTGGYLGHELSPQIVEKLQRIDLVNEVDLAD